jgi:mannan endo-1,6-alpha-mannosidase
VHLLACNMSTCADLFPQGNDDQAFWALAIMSALEYQFPDPEGDVPATYLQVAENCFNNIVSRWDTATCNGGLKWQIYPENAYGYNYKNSISNGATFALGARLARYTGNQTYADWATKIYDWSKEAGFISEKYEVFDGADDRKDCKNPDKTEWSYNLGVYIHGAATLFDITKGDEKWKKETQGFLDHAGIFFKAYDNATDILYEVPCETGATGRICNLDQQSFKAYLARFLAKTAVLAPFTKDQITTWLKTSAVAAAKSCADDGTQCGSKWYTGSYDGQTGTGQQLSALEVTQALLTLKRDTKPATGSEQPKHEPKPSSTPAPSSAPASEAPKSDAPKSEAPKTETPADAPSSTAPSAEAAPTSASPVDQKAPAEGQCTCGTTTVTVYEPPAPSSTPCTTSTTLTVTVPFPTPTGNATVPGNVTVPSNPPNNTGPDQFQGAGSSFKVTALTLVGAAVLAALSGLF